eukprot:jgi/Mesvir1/13806/Mv25591-RA.1
MEGGNNYPQQIIDALQQPITQARCATIRGMLAWLASICAPDLLVLSRLTDAQLVEVGAEQVVESVRSSPPLILTAVDLYKPINMVLFVDSSMDSRKVTDVRGRAAALITLQQEHTSLVSWYSRLQNRVTPSSDIAECRAICEGLHTALYLRELFYQLCQVASCSLQLHTLVKTDSMGMVQFVHRQLARSRDLDYLLLKEMSYLAHLEHVPGVDNPADALTKLESKAELQYPVLKGLMYPFSGGT